MQSEANRSLLMLNGPASLDDIETNSLLRACNTLTRIMSSRINLGGTPSDKEDAKLHPDEVGLSCVKFMARRLFVQSLAGVDSDRYHSRSPEELRSLVRVLVSAADMKRRMHHRFPSSAKKGHLGSRAPKAAAAPEAKSGISDPASQLPIQNADRKEPGVSLFELYRRNAVLLIEREMNAYLLLPPTPNSRGHLNNERFLIACIEAWVFYLQSDSAPAPTRSGSETCENTNIVSQCNAHCMKMCAKMLLKLMRKDPAASSASPWMRDRFASALFRTKIALFNLGPPFLDPFFQIQDKWKASDASDVLPSPESIVRLFFLPVQPLFQSCDLSGAVKGALEAVLTIQDRRVAETKSARITQNVLYACLRADALAHAHGLYSNSPCVDCAFERLALTKEHRRAGEPAGVSPLNDMEARFIVQCVEPGDAQVPASVGPAIMSSKRAMDIVLRRLSWKGHEKSYLQRFWNAFVFLDVAKADVQAADFDFSALIHFYETLESKSGKDHRNCAERAVACVLAGEAARFGRGIFTSHNNKPGWKYIAHIALRDTLQRSTLRRSVGSQAEVRTGPLQMSCAIRAILCAVAPQEPCRLHAWVRATSIVSSLGARRIERANEEGAAWRPVILREARDLVEAAAALWTCPFIQGILEMPLKGDNRAGLLLDMMRVALRAARYGTMALRDARYAHQSMHMSKPSLLRQLDTALDRLHHAAQRATARCVKGRSESADSQLDEILSILSYKNRGVRAALSTSDADLSDAPCAEQTSCGSMDPRFAAYLIRATAAGKPVEPTAMRAYAGARLLPHAVRCLVFHSHTPGSLGALCEAARFCAQTLRWNGCGDNASNRESEEVLRLIVEAGPPAAVEAALSSLVGAPPTPTGPWDWPVPSKAILAVVTQDADPLTWNSVLKRTRAAFWAAKEPSHQLCASYATAMLHCTSDREREEESSLASVVVTQSRGEAPAPGAWAALTWCRGGMSFGARNNRREGKSLISEAPDADPRPPLPVAESCDEFIQICKSLADSGRISRSVPGSIESLQMTCADPAWIRQYVQDSAASGDEESLLLAFLFLQRMKPSGAYTEEERASNRVLARALRPLMTRRSVGPATGIQQGCIEALSGLGRRMRSPWGLRLAIARWMALKVPSEGASTIVHAYLMHTYEHQSDTWGESDMSRDLRACVQSSVEAAIRASESGSAGLASAAKSVASWGACAAQSKRISLCRAWADMASIVSEFSPDVKTRSQIRVVSCNVLQMCLLVHGKGSSRWNDVPYDRMRGIVRHAFQAVQSEDGRAEHSLRLIVESQFMLRAKLSSDLGTFPPQKTYVEACSALRAYATWALLAQVAPGASQAAQKGERPPYACHLAAAHVLRNTSAVLDRMASYALGKDTAPYLSPVSRNTFDSLVRVVVRDSLCRGHALWVDAATRRSVHRSTGLYLSHKWAGPPAWQGVVLAAGSGWHDGEGAAEPCGRFERWARAAKAGLAPRTLDEMGPGRGWSPSPSFKKRMRDLEGARARVLAQLMDTVHRNLSGVHSFSNGDGRSAAPCAAQLTDFARTLVNIAASPKWWRGAPTASGETFIRDAASVRGAQDGAARLWESILRGAVSSSDLEHCICPPLRESKTQTPWIFLSLHRLLTNYSGSLCRATVSKWLWYARAELTGSCDAYPPVLRTWSAWAMAAVASSRSASSLATDRTRAIMSGLMGFLEGSPSAPSTRKTTALDRAVAHACAGIAMQVAMRSDFGVQNAPSIIATLVKVMRLCASRRFGLYAYVNEMGKRVEEEAATLRRRAEAWSDETCPPRSRRPMSAIRTADVLEIRCVSLLRAGLIREFLCESLGSCARLCNGHFRVALDAALDADWGTSIERYVLGLAQARWDTASTRSDRANESAEGCGEHSDDEVIPNVLTQTLFARIAQTLALRADEPTRHIVTSLLTNFGAIGSPEPPAVSDARQSRVVQRAKCVLAKQCAPSKATSRLTRPPDPIFVGTSSGPSGAPTRLPPLDDCVLTLARSMCAVVACWSSEVQAGSIDHSGWGSSALERLSGTIKSISVGIRRACRWWRTKEAAQRADNPSAVVRAANACAHLGDGFVEALRRPGSQSRIQCERIARSLVSPHRRHLLPVFSGGHQYGLKTNRALRRATVPHDFADSRCIDMYASVVRYVLLCIVEISRACGRLTAETGRDELPSCAAGECALIALQEWGGAHGDQFSAMHARHALSACTWGVHDGSDARDAQRDPRVFDVALEAKDAFACEAQIAVCALSSRSCGILPYTRRALRGLVSGIPRSDRDRYAAAFTCFSFMRAGGSGRQRALLTEKQHSALSLIANQVVFDPQQAKGSLWDVAGTSRAMRCVGLHAARQLAKSALSMKEQETNGEPGAGAEDTRLAGANLCVHSAAHLFWLAGVLGAARSLEPRYVAFESLVSPALETVLGAAVSRQDESWRIAENFLGSKASISAQSIRPLARHAIWSAHDAAAKQLPPLETLPAPEEAVPNDASFLDRLDEACPPSKRERAALSLYEVTERVVSALSRNQYPADDIHSLESRARKAQSPPSSAFEAWKQACCGAAGLARPVPAPLVDRGIQLCAKLCERSVARLETQDFSDGLLDRVEKGARAVGGSPWDKNGGLLSQLVPGVDARGGVGFVSRVMLRGDKGSRPRDACLAWKHPDLSVPWAPRAYRRYSVDVESKPGPGGWSIVRRYALTMHWEAAQGAWSGSSAGMERLGALTALSVVAGCGAFDDRIGVRDRGGAGLGVGVQPSAAAALRGPKRASRVQLRSGRVAYLIPEEEAHSRQTLATVLARECKMHTSAAYIARSLLPPGEPCDPLSPAGALSRAIRKRARSLEHNPERGLAESAAAWFAVLGGTRALSEEPLWPSMVVHLPSGVLEYPDLSGLAAQNPERFAWSEMVRCAVGEPATEAYFLPAIRFYRHACMMNRDAMVSASALGYVCAGLGAVQSIVRSENECSASMNAWVPLAESARAHLWGQRSVPEGHAVGESGEEDEVCTPGDLCETVKYQHYERVVQALEDDTERLAPPHARTLPSHLQHRLDQVASPSWSRARSGIDHVLELHAKRCAIPVSPLSKIRDPPERRKRGVRGAAGSARSRRYRKRKARSASSVGRKTTLDRPSKKRNRSRNKA